MAVPGLDPGISPAIHVFSAPPVDKAQARPHANRVSPDNIRSPPVSKSTHKTTKPRQHSHTNPHPCQGNFSYFTTARTRLPLHRHAGEGLQSTSFPLSSPRRRPGSTTSLLACPNPQSIPLHRLGPRRRTIHASLPSPALNCPVIIISPLDAAAQVAVTADAMDAVKRDGVLGVVPCVENGFPSAPF